MDVFLIWLFVIVVFLTLYTIILIRRSPKGFHLEIKLTIIFFLLVLIPSITLTLFVSGLLTQGVEMSFMPEIEGSLASSIQAIKHQLESRGHEFMDAINYQPEINKQKMMEHNISFLGHYQVSKKTIQELNSVTTREYPDPQLNYNLVHMILDGEISSTFITQDDRHYCQVYRPLPDSTISVVGFNVDRQVIAAKNKVSESLKIYTSLSLVKKSVLEGRFIWALATLFIITLVLIAIYSARKLSRGISMPIRKLAFGMQRVAEGDFSSKVEVEAKDEIKILVDSFNKMRHDLQASQERLVQVERLAAWRDVARRVSHEIKNSLTPIQISLFRLKSKMSQPEQNAHAELVRSIEEELESLRRISDEFSQFARMPGINKERININDIITNLIPILEGGSKPIKIETELDASVPGIMLDRDNIKRALNNLIKNSIEASKVGGKIIIKTTPVPDPDKTVKITIQDFGEGMDQEILEKIFEPYFTTKRRGMGLGLSIVRRIIEDHDGDISIHSSRGKGTAVIILF
ncbi:HAMP domain-containing protein [candidate division KSB1 bacterium]|nr:HAMP domain-containing protein [candidate division KSB1 bacterium]